MINLYLWQDAYDLAHGRLENIQTFMLTQYEIMSEYTWGYFDYE